MNLSSVMAEGLAGYLDVVMKELKPEENGTCVTMLHYKEAFENFQNNLLEEVPEDVLPWIDESTTKQFNEELQGVLPTFTNLLVKQTKLKN